MRRELREQVDARTLGLYQSFFKEKVVAYGVKSSLVTKIALKYFPEIKKLTKKERKDKQKEMAAQEKEAKAGDMSMEKLSAK